MFYTYKDLWEDEYDFRRKFTTKSEAIYSAGAEYVNELADGEVEIMIAGYDFNAGIVKFIGEELYVLQGD